MRHIASSDNSSAFLTAEFDNYVYAWDICSFTSISKFETVLEYGGDRLAISDSGRFCVAAAYNSEGICMYEIATGSIIWCRKDINNIQMVKYGVDGDVLFIGADEKYLTILDSTTGKVIDKIDRVTNIYQNRYGQDDCFLKGKTKIEFGTKKIVSPTFAFLDVAPTDSGIATSAVGSVLRFTNYYGEKIWEVKPGEGKHFTQLYYTQAYGILYAILYAYKDHSGAIYAVWGIDTKNGLVVFKYDLPENAVAFGFAACGKKLICSSGEIYTLSKNVPVLANKIEWDDNGMPAIS